MPATQIRWNAPRKSWIALCEDSTVHTWDQAGKHIRYLNLGSSISCFALNSQSGDVVCGCGGRRVIVVDPETSEVSGRMAGCQQCAHDDRPFLQVVMEYVGHSDNINAIVHVPEGEVVCCHLLRGR